MRPLLLALVLLAAIWPATSAADEFFYEITDYTGNPATITGSCNYAEHPFPGLNIGLPYTMKGYFVFDQPVSGVRIFLPNDRLIRASCPDAVLGTTTFHYPWSGDPYYEVDVDFGGCLTGTVHVFTRTVEIRDDCTLGGIFGPGYSDPVSLGCDAVERVIDDLSACTAPPTNLMPPDGATDVSISPTMTCAWTAPQHCGEGIGLVIYSVYLGTDPDNLEFAGWQDYNEVIVGPLEPNTAYYWRMRVWDDYWNCPGSSAAWSPVLSFTTAAPLQTEERTWGAIKALYQANE